MKIRRDNKDSAEEKDTEAPTSGFGEALCDELKQTLIRRCRLSRFATARAQIGRSTECNDENVSQLVPHRLSDVQCSATSTHVGAWSLVFSIARTSRSTPAVFSRGASSGLRSRWSMRRPALRENAPRM
jgi:hypothetical protein